MQKKTFRSLTVGPKKFQFIALPHSNFFSFTLVSHMGANVERAYQRKTGKNVFGIAHLIEHLAFKSCKDFTTEALLNIGKNMGSINAGTTCDYIDYIFETTVEHIDLAIKVVLNLVYNDLSKLSLNEFETEKMVIINEIKRYMDDDQTMFAYNISPAVCGYEEGDNILGMPSVIETFTLEDVKSVKHILLNNEHITYNIMYDPSAIDQQTLMDTILRQEERIKPTFAPCVLSYQEYTKALTTPHIGSFAIENEAEQVMNILVFSIKNNVYLAEIVSKYFENYAQESSLDYFIRQQNGLSYEISTWTDTISHKPYLFFSCDVSLGNEERLMQLFKESIDETVTRFNQEKYDTFIKAIALQKTLANINLGNYQSMFISELIDPNVLEPFLSSLAEDIDEGYKNIYTTLASFEKMHEAMLAFQKDFKEGNFIKVTNVSHNQ